MYESEVMLTVLSTNIFMTRVGEGNLSVGDLYSVA